MCAMMALIAPRELRILKSRVIQFLDAYIGIFELFVSDASANS
jgi:hypothetical protein